MPRQILVVDDEPDVELLVRQRFRRNIRDKEFEFFFSLNGVEALKVLAENPGIQLVVTDINMPVMDGLTLLSHLGALSKTRKAVIVSAYGDMPNIRAAMNRGAADFLVKPLNTEDMEATIRKTLDLVAQLAAAEDHSRRLTAIQQELEMAARIQQTLLPAGLPVRSDFELHAAMLPAKEVGGDFFDFLFLDSDRLAFAVGDVSGKGVPAAIFMAISQMLLRGAARQDLSPGACLDHVNRTLAPMNTRAMFVTLFYGILNVKTGELQFSNGGHDSPFLFSPEAGVRPLLCNERGLVVGVLDESVYATESCVLAPGEAILVTTDGVSEAMNPLDELYGVERLQRFIADNAASSARQLVTDLFGSIETFAAGAPQADDITILALRRLPAA